MTREELVALAYTCDLNRVCGALDTLLDHEWEDLHRFAELVAKHEREKCLEIADQCADADMHASMAANAIRARGNHV